MELVRFANTVSSEEIINAVKEHGYCIIDNLVDSEVMDKIAEEMAEFIDTSPYGCDRFLGHTTKRTGSLVARSETARELIALPVILDAAQKHLSKSSTFQLNLTQIISVYPGSPAQVLHQDQLTWDFFNFPDEFETQFNLLWALTDYTEENSATRLVPKSMYAGTRQKFTPEQTVCAEMKKGSVLIYTGKIYHGAGENKTDKVRQSINITYSAGWLRQEENQYLATPPEIAATLSDDMLKLMGYQCACFALGYVRDFEDPLNVFRNKQKRIVPGLNIVKENGHDIAKSYALEEI
ncbi:MULTISPECIES: phytanoyl-CoA dioxygenase family protein [unclassified Acinetobacter]|uniref:phytanoyl-CoA dioxygenase family protein n=1 Tax=unclassified Acinetobacter TaxID=196816 RepID=UPI001C23390B|nr:MULTISPECIES: phytanoyl-CoA dioxygenase family protein [unclassified Acinetobacter]